MQALRTFLLSVTGAAVICSVAIKIPVKGAPAGLLRMICGIFMLLCFLRPLTDLKLGEFVPVTELYRSEAEEIAAQGENLARQAMEEIIKTQAEAYILDKAADLGVSLDVCVSLTSQDLPVPQGVILTGSVSPYQRSVLSQEIEKHLGIEGGKIQWNQP